MNLTGYLKARKFPAGPVTRMEGMKASRIPAGGWTTAELSTRNGRNLWKDLVRAQRLAVTSAGKELTAKLVRFFNVQSEQIIAHFDRMYFNQVGRLKSAGEKSYSVLLTPGVHESLWASALDEVIAAEGLEFTNIMQGAIQSAADISGRQTANLLGGIGSDLTQLRRNQRVKDLASRVTGISKTRKMLLRRALQNAIYRDGLTVAETVAVMREKFPTLAASRIPTIVRTEMGRAADEGRKLALKEASVAYVSVIGCLAREAGSPQYRGESTCNIQNVPISDIDQLVFHPNHTGTIVPSAFIDPPSR